MQLGKQFFISPCYKRVSWNKHLFLYLFVFPGIKKEDQSSVTSILSCRNLAQPLLAGMLAVFTSRHPPYRLQCQAQKNKRTHHTNAPSFRTHRRRAVCAPRGKSMYLHLPTRFDHWYQFGDGIFHRTEAFDLCAGSEIVLWYQNRF
jgi:hypothetical protein